MEHSDSDQTNEVATESTELGDNNEVEGLLKHYKRMLLAGESGNEGGTESPGEGGDLENPNPDLSDGAISDRKRTINYELNRIVKDFLGNDPKLYVIVNQITGNADKALRVLRAGDEKNLYDPSVLDGLETIVRTNGSRPSFMIRNGVVDKATSPLGGWENTLDATANIVNDAIACVGRINLPGSAQGFQGTGFLIHKNLIITNRHVLQEIAVRQDDLSWKFKPNAHIDFGHEFRVVVPPRRREFRRVVFSGSRPINPTSIDHTKFDFALIELEDVPESSLPLSFLSIDKAPDWATPNLPVFVIGYPGDPGLLSFTPSLLEDLFKSTYGCKRLAPGLVMPQSNTHNWTFSHDATTLGGNSGSVVVYVGRAMAAAGLHYGGRRAQPAENWAHILGQTLDETDGHSNKTLREILTDYGVQFIDRI